MQEWAIMIVLAGMGLVLLRALLGPTVYDRILAANAFGTKTVAFIALLCLVFEDTIFLDIALIYALINFIATIAFLKYFTAPSLGRE